MFKNRYQYTTEDSEKCISESGTGIVELHGLKLDEYGCDVLVKTGTHDLNAEIQSYADDCDLSKVLELLGMNPDPSMAPELKITDEVLDLTKIPRTLGGWNDFTRKLDDYWSTLDPALRANIGNIYNLPDYIKETQHKLDMQMQAIALAEQHRMAAEAKIDNVNKKGGESLDG